MFGAIAGGIASALAGGAMSKLFGGGQKAASKQFRHGATDRKSGSAGMPRPISYAVFCLKKKNALPWAIRHRHPVGPRVARELELLAAATGGPPRGFFFF